MSELYIPAVIPLSPGKQGNTNSVDLSRKLCRGNFFCLRRFDDRRNLINLSFVRYLEEKELLTFLKSTSYQFKINSSMRIKEIKFCLWDHLSVIYNGLWIFMKSLTNIIQVTICIKVISFRKFPQSNHVLPAVTNLDIYIYKSYKHL